MEMVLHLVLCKALGFFSLGVNESLTKEKKLSEFVADSNLR